MELWKVHQVIEMIARRHGVTEESVASDIECAMAEMRCHIYASGDKEKIVQWEAIPCKGEVPTAYEMVAYLSERVKEMV